MESLESELLERLLELERVVASGPSGPALASLFSEIDALAARLPSGADPQLVHYLHRKSYQKARLFLQGRDGENQSGHCIRHRD